MQAEKQQSWKISIHARAKNLDFKFESETVLPTWKLQRFSIQFKLRKYFLKVESEPSISIPRKPRITLKSRLLWIFEKLKIRSAKNRDVVAKKTLKTQYPEIKSHANRLQKFAIEEEICVGFLFIGALTFLSQSISGKGLKESIIHGAAILLCFGFFLHKFITRKTSTLLLVLVIATVVCSVLLHFESLTTTEYLNYFPI